jgi:hypothetical protein
MGDHADQLGRAQEADLDVEAGEGAKPHGVGVSAGAGRHDPLLEM